MDIKHSEENVRHRAFCHCTEYKSSLMSSFSVPCVKCPRKTMTEKGRESLSLMSSSPPTPSSTTLLLVTSSGRSSKSLKVSQHRDRPPSSNIEEMGKTSIKSSGRSSSGSTICKRKGDKKDRCRSSKPSSTRGERKDGKKIRKKKNTHEMHDDRRNDDHKYSKQDERKDHARRSDYTASTVMAQSWDTASDTGMDATALLSQVQRTSVVSTAGVTETTSALENSDKASKSSKNGVVKIDEIMTTEKIESPKNKKKKKKEKSSEAKKKTRKKKNENRGHQICSTQVDDDLSTIWHGNKVNFATRSLQEKGVPSSSTVPVQTCNCGNMSTKTIRTKRKKAKKKHDADPARTGKKKTKKSSNRMERKVDSVHRATVTLSDSVKRSESANQKPIRTKTKKRKKHQKPKSPMDMKCPVTKGQIRKAASSVKLNGRCISVARQVNRPPRVLSTEAPLNRKISYTIGHDPWGLSLFSQQSQRTMRTSLAKSWTSKQSQRVMNEAESCFMASEATSTTNESGTSSSSLSSTASAEKQAWFVNRSYSKGQDRLKNPNRSEYIMEMVFFDSTVQDDVMKSK